MSNITFVIPAYNAATTLEEAVASVFNHNFSTGDAVIIVNDASTDTTAAVASTLAERYAPHLTLITNAVNRGCPASRNVGIARATTPLIMNLDADNILLPNSIEKLREALSGEGADIAAFATYRYFVDDSRFITHFWHCRPGIFTLADLLAGHINPGPGGNFLYTKQSWERIGGYWEYGKGLHEAWGFTLKQLAAGAKMIVVPGSAYLHRHGHASLFATESKKKTEEYALTMKMIQPYLDRLDPADRQYVETTPAWYELLATHPLHLVGQPTGHTGQMQRTWYGYYLTMRQLLRLRFCIYI
jgi:glycosyltransferase involved in cell wall biosynthesis